MTLGKAVENTTLRSPSTDLYNSEEEDSGEENLEEENLEEENSEGENSEERI